MQVEIQQGNVLPLGSVVYRKQSNCPSAVSTSLLASSDNSFQFNFVLPDRTTGETDRTTAEDGLGDSREQSTGNGLSRTLDFSTGTGQPGFAFSFIIPDASSASADATDPGSGASAEAAPEINVPSKEAMVTTEKPAFSQPDRTDGMDCGSRHGEEHPIQEVPRLEDTQVGTGEPPSFIKPWNEICT